MPGQERWQVGDILVHPAFPDVRREIVDVRATGYGWRYPDLGEKTAIGADNLFDSEASTDPMFESGWQREAAPLPKP